jgi:hypothetical protein
MRILLGLVAALGVAVGVGQCVGSVIQGQVQEAQEVQEQEVSLK